MDHISTPSSRERSTSIAASQRSRTSSSSGENRQRMHKKKPSAFKSFFAVKEPSAVAFQHLAQAMKEEMGEKGQRPFGVPSGKIPASAEADYKQAKEKAKEKAKLYQEAKERQRLQEVYERTSAKARSEQSNRPSIVVDERTEEELLRDQLQQTAQAMNYVSLDPRPSTSSSSASSSASSSLPIPLPAHKKTHSRWRTSSLTALPETTSVSPARSLSPPSNSATPSSPVPSSPSHVPAKAQEEVAPREDSGVSPARAGIRKQDVAPWEEEDEEEEFPMRQGAKKSKNYFSTLIRR